MHRTLLTLVFAGLASTALANGSKISQPTISEELSIPQSQIEVLDSTMAYLEEGQGDPVLFIHGNPTSSYLWRNIIPHVSDTHRAIAVDLIGMGASGKPALGYTFEDHLTYLTAFVDELDLEDITLVTHDWGAALGWEYARQHPENIVRIAFMEGVLPPSFPIEDISTMGEVGQALAALRSDKGQQMVIEGNMFVEQMLPGFVNRQLGEAAMTVYRQPYLEKAARAPTLQWPRELPIEGNPASTTRLMSDISAFMQNTEMPVLALYADPGVVGPAATMDWYRKTIQDIETVFVGQGLHFIQEDQPLAIGRALDDWIRRN